MIVNDKQCGPSLVLVMNQESRLRVEQSETTLPRPALTQAFFDLTNEARIANNRPPLLREPRLMETAEAKAIDMAEFQYFGHVSPRLGDPTQQFRDRWGFVPAGGIGENIVWVSRLDDDAAQAMIDALLASPNHRENILLDRWEHSGVAVVEDTVQGRLYGVQQFAGAN